MHPTSFQVALLQFGSAKSPESSEDGEARDESGILRQIRQLQDLKRMVIQNQADGIQFHAGCTAVVAFKHANMLYVANAGDSRGVLCREGVHLVTGTQAPKFPAAIMRLGVRCISQTCSEYAPALKFPAHKPR